MAKRMKKILIMCLVLLYSISLIATPTMAKGYGDNGSSTQTEWYQVIVNGNTVASASGSAGDHTWLVQGTYSWDVSVSGTTMNWRAGKHSGSVKLENYITIPDGFAIAEGGYTVEHKSVDGVNSQSANFDNAIITVTISALYNPITGETIPVEPDPTDPIPVETKVTVNHKYSTYDIYTGETVLDGTTSNTADATEGDTFTAVSVPTYNGNAYEQTGVDPAMSITVKADAAQNVINIEYLRTVDTTPIPVETKVTVNHKYSTYDIYTGKTVLDGTTSNTADATEGDTYTAVSVPTYNGNAYEQTGVDPAMSITVKAEAAQNVINIEYLRTVDTTPIPVETKVTVNHKYSTYDIYTGQTTQDGTVSRTVNAIEGDTFTTTAVPSYNGNAYEQTGVDPAMSITVKADAAQNVINIEYLRTVDTTPIPVETKVTVNHKYSTYDVYTGATVVDGTTSNTADATEGDTYTAVAVPVYNGNAYVQQTAASALTIAVKADAAQNVINIEYLRTIDTTPENYAPSLDMIKTAAQASYKEGETVSWTITVKNVSSYPAYDVVVTDDLTGDRWTIAELAPGAQQSFTATLENAPVGTVKNVAVVTWNDGDEIPDEKEPQEPKVTKDEEIVEVREIINYTPVVIVNKVADKTTYENGETITWTIGVMNIGAHTAYNVVITDELTGDVWIIDSLAPFRYTTFTATTENAAAGSLKNVVVATWDDCDEIPDEQEPNEIKSASDEEIVSILDPAPENFTPVLSVVKTAEQTTYKEGEPIAWTITVKNVSDYTAYNVVVEDRLANGYWTIDALEPGAEKTFTATMENVAAGSVKNTVVVTWNDGDEIPDEEESNEINETSDEEIVIVEERENFAPMLNVTKVAHKASYKVGEIITWTITVTNVGNDTAYGVEVIDEMVGAYWTIHTLEPGAERSFVVTMSPEEAGTVKNVVVVSWDDGDEIPDEEELDEEKTVSDEEIVEVEKPTPIDPDPVDPDPVDPDPTEPEPTEGEDPVVPMDDEIEIPDEDVPLADAPKTGDISALWVALTGLSAGGMILLSKKREDDEE